MRRGGTWKQDSHEWKTAWVERIEKSDKSTIKARKGRYMGSQAGAKGREKNSRPRISSLKTESKT